MATEELDFSEDIKIDQDALDVEWLRQAELMGKYNRLHADAEAKVGRLKQKLEVLDAQLDSRIRTKPKAYGIGSDKPTEAAIKGALIMVPERQEAVARHLKAIHDAAVVLSAVRALHHKRDALENLVRLMGAEYFSGPVAPRDLGHERTKAKMSEKANGKMKDAVEARKRPSK